MLTFNTKRASEQVFGRTGGQAGGEEELSHPSPPGHSAASQVWGWGGGEAGEPVPGARDNEERDVLAPTLGQEPNSLENTCLGSPTILYKHPNHDARRSVRETALGTTGFSDYKKYWRVSSNEENI